MILESHGSSNTLHLFADLLCLKKKLTLKKQGDNLCFIYTVL